MVSRLSRFRYGEFPRAVRLENSWKGQEGFDGGSDFQGNLDKGFPPSALEMFEKGCRNATRLGDLDILPFQHGGESKQILLGRFMIGRVVTAGAFHVDPEERRSR